MKIPMKEDFIRDIKVFPQPQFTVAFGAAAILLKEKKKQKK